MEEIKVTSIFFIFLSFAAELSFAQQKHEIVWNTMEEFLSGGWSFISEDWGKGKSFNKPSDLNKDLNQLDSGILGNGVWTGSEKGRVFGFMFSLNQWPEIRNATKANIHIRYYMAPVANPSEPAILGFYPCKEAADNFCRTLHTKTTDGWTVKSFEVNLSSWEVWRLWTYWEKDLRFSLLDQVKLSYEMPEEEMESTTTDASMFIPPTTTSTSTDDNNNACNESCEYRAVDCHTFYSCVNYERKEFFQCSKEDGLAFNPELGTCDRMENVMGCAAPKVNCTCEYRPDPKNCSNYYFCPDNCKEELCERKSCPGDLLWSVDLYQDGSNVQQCTVPQKAVCSDGEEENITASSIPN